MHEQSRRWILILIVAIIVAAGCVAGALLMHKKSGDDSQKSEAEQQVAGPASGNVDYNGPKDRSSDASKVVSVDVTDDEYYNLNIYASNFTEAWLKSFTAGHYPADELLDFAYEHILFNKPDAVEWTDDIFFESDGEYNARVAKKDINHTLQRFFGEDITIDRLSGINENYIDGYYYSYETGGNTPNGFALLDAIEKEEDVYTCHFYVYGMGLYDSKDTKYYSWTDAQAMSEFGESNIECTMKIRTKALSDRKAYTLLEYELLD